MPATLILANDKVRSKAKHWVDIAPAGVVVTFAKPKRTLDQNAKLWAMLMDISRAMPDGRRHTTEMWKAIFMQACGHEIQFLMGIDGNPFPAGFRSSKMTKAQMGEMIEFIYAYGAEHEVKWSEYSK
jgi:hypothetical protein